MNLKYSTGNWMLIISINKRFDILYFYCTKSIIRNIQFPAIVFMNIVLCVMFSPYHSCFMFGKVLNMNRLLTNKPIIMKTKTLLSLILMGFAVSAFTQVIQVPSDKGTIQAGILAANTGDTVLVANGIYAENINFRGKAITVASLYIQSGDTNDINNTIINGSTATNPDSAAVVIFNSGEDTTSVLYGFTITGGSGVRHSLWNAQSGGGISLWNSGAKIIHNKITGNSVTGTNWVSGGGIGSWVSLGKFWLVIDDNVISNNTVIMNGSAAFGGGIFVGTNARICNNIIEYNLCENQADSSDADGGGVFWETQWGSYDTVYFKNNIVRNNSLESYRARGAGVITYKSTAWITGNQFLNNTSTGTRARGAGIHAYQVSGDLEIQNNSFIGNTCQGISSAFGSAITLLNISSSSSVQILNNEVINNTASASNSYGPVFTWDAYDAEVIVDGNRFQDNTTGGSAGGFYARNSYNLRLTNNIFSGNSVGASGGGIYMYEYYAKDKPDITAFPPDDDLPEAKEAMKSDDYRPLFMNNTFYDNYAGFQGGAMKCEYSTATPVLLNNIFWKDDAVGGGDEIFINSDSNWYIGYSNIDPADIYGNWDGKGNINEDPEFVDPENNDFHISCASSCWNKGVDSIEINTIWYYYTLYDFEGNPRPDIYYLIPDIGAYEFPDTCVFPGVYEPIIQNSESKIQNHPNPFSRISNIEYRVSNIELIQLKILNIQGQEISTLVNEIQAAGNYTVVFDATSLPAGIYICILKTSERTESVKMVKLK